MLVYGKYIDISKEVLLALDYGKPVVALGTTIISHEIPYPLNIEAALNVEKIIRKEGVVPASIAIIDGRVKVGLTKDELEYIANPKNKIIKTSRRDIPTVIAKKLDGSTTVASTMIMADTAGIKIMISGGIGGVHRGASETFDISADLEELEKTDVAVVCSGIKPILDIRLTLELLETKGVPVIGYKTKVLPTYFTRTSEYKVDSNIESVEELANAIKAKWDLDLRGGVVIANPIPKEFEMDYDVINLAIEKAIEKSIKLEIKGNMSTQFLQEEIRKLTNGESLKSSIKLLYNNARLSAKLAREYSKLD
ncbi:MAG: pseudouridine-5'-phosphate glycosidase [Psychrilyobacter sp.]|nr:pseudouridine-5'-phosphate glycosidase [Psychrilyobacter sp.]